MRKVILNLAVSLDGFIEGANGEYDWCFTDQDYGMSEFFKRTDAIFLGRKSYELVKKTGDDYFGERETYVFSKTLGNINDKRIHVISENVAENVNSIKNDKGKDIWLFGGASLVTTFMNEDLVDELMLAVHPILLGSGKPLFSDVQGPIKLHLTDAKTFSTGLVQMFYDVLTNG